MYALKLLERIEQGQPIQEALADCTAAKEQNSLDSRDRALLSELVYGTMRAHLRLDYILGRYLEKPGDLPRQVLQIIRLGLYELLYHGQNCDYAAINEAVSLVRHFKFAKLNGLVNAILRRAQRERELLSNPGWYCEQGAASGKAVQVQPDLKSSAAECANLTRKFTAPNTQAKPGLELREAESFGQISAKANTVGKASAEAPCPELPRERRPNGKGELEQELNQASILSSACSIPAFNSSFETNFKLFRPQNVSRETFKHLIQTSLVPGSCDFLQWAYSRGQRQLIPEIQAKAIFYSMPEPILRLWLDAYGAEAVDNLLLRSSRRPWTGLRINRRHPKAAELLSALADLALAESAKLPGISSVGSDNMDQPKLPSSSSSQSQAEDPRTGLDSAPQIEHEDFSRHLGQEACAYSALPLSRSMQGIASLGDYGFAFAPGALPEQLLGQSMSYWQAQGLLSFQSAGSQWLMQELGLAQWASEANALIWDACAGVGGKALWLAEQGARIALASDTSSKRLYRLRKDCLRLGLAQITAVQADAAQAPLKSQNSHSKSMRILLDAPCSGLGILARRPDMRLAGRRSAKDLVDTYPEIQRRLLSACLALLLPGGELAYLTCTLNPLENEQQILTALKANPDLELIGICQTDIRHPWLEGMFGARLRRRG